ncbi:MAG: transcription-repair coupling factor, partial [Actinomycetia bacterium]|nr:transcription-repair coupling factor [Actinomycetes bacterium]
RELARGGQIFFLHNSVETIDTIAAYLKMLFPDASIITGHGQMAKTTLGKNIQKFIDHKYDILVCTTIIENGIDIPNVNTIYINKADRLGLSQLYQLKGRVGRSDRQAYAYLLYSDDRIVSDKSKKRLRIIQDLSELGSGFQVALHDLEIRGAGNLLGQEQHGDIIDIGFELYCQLLEQTVIDLKDNINKKKDKLFIRDVEIAIPLNIFIDKEYMESPSQRIELYKRMANAPSVEVLKKMKKEIIDRYGRLPLSVINLFDFEAIRITCAKLGIRRISEKNKFYILDFDKERNIDIERIINTVSRSPLFKFNPGNQFLLQLHKLENDERVLEYLKNMILKI